MDAGMDYWGGFIFFFVFWGVLVPFVSQILLVPFVPVIILDIIWYKRVKSGKSPKFGPLGIISIVATAGALLGIIL
ncbi:MAG: hypothetical protein K6E77_12440, partial [Lachnospiraceae bacterium]|nr:hypothetical protein [Lachnospiraceae bacterium]